MGAGGSAYMDDSRFPRRTFLGGSLVFLAGCGANNGSDEPELPLAQGDEDDMPQPQQDRNGLTQPLILWGSVIAEPNVDSAVPNEQLANPFGLPMEILAIRFRITPVIPDSFPGGGEPDQQPNARMTGGGVKVKLDLGPAAVASDIPISTLGDMRDTYENGGPVISPVVTNLGPEYPYVYPTTYDWRLKYPLFVPGGKVLTSVFTPIGINPLSVRIDVIYICRTWDQNRPEPTKIKVPWATSFETKTFKYETSAPADQSVSANLDIINPFGSPLELSRLSGRCTLLQLTGGVTQQNYIIEDLGEFRQVLATMRMRSSRGFDLIRTPVAFDGVFPVNWRSWDILDGWQLAPQEYYRTQIDTIAVPGTITVESIQTAQFSIAIVGYREVSVASLKGAK